MASKSPSVPQTAPAMVPKCSSRLMRITESPVFWSVLRGANVRMASHPGCKSTLCIWLKGPKCIKRSPTWDLVPAWIFKSYTRLVVKLFKYIWKKYKILKTDAKILRLLKCNCNNALLLAYLLTLQLLEQFTIFHLKFYRIIEEKKEFGKRCFLLKAFKKKARGFESFFSNPLIVVCHLCNACVFLYTIKTSCILSPFLSSALISKQAKIQYGFLPKCDRHSFQAIFNLKDENIEGVKKSSKFSSTRCHCSCHVKFACLSPCLLFCTYTRWFWHFLVTTPLTKVFLLVVFLNYKINKYCESHLSQFYILAKLPLSNMVI